MNDSLLRTWRSLFPAWLCCVLLPMPALVLWRTPDGVRTAVGLFFIGCAGLVAHSFRREIETVRSEHRERPEWMWRRHMATTGAALLAALAAFSAACLALINPPDHVKIGLAALILIPSLCVTPYLTLATRKPFAAVVFTLFLVFCTKLASGLVVVLVYGWHASEYGHTEMPWTRPNLHVWMFWLNSAVLSLALYQLGKRRFLRDERDIVNTAGSERADLAAPGA